MVPFAGWEMPVQYPDQGIIQSHHHTREKASIFDVSHMLQFKIHGKDRVKCFEQLVVADVEGMAPGTGGLSLFMNDQGGIRDDTIINNAGDHLYIVSNAGCAHKIKPLVEAHIASCKSTHDVELEFLEDKSLIALQGPLAATALQAGVPADLSPMKFMNGQDMDVFGVGSRVTRCGYTGEDGFEISIPSDRVVSVVENLLGEDGVKLAGLGARDTLRLEAGLCLYGNDIDETTTPSEAVLVWTLGKRRRQLRDFPGAEIVLNMIKAKPSKKRIGLMSTSGPPARGHTQVVDESGEVVGEVTSGCPSPTLKYNIAMAYVPTALSKVGTQLFFKKGKKTHLCSVVKMPFHPTNYVM